MSIEDLLEVNYRPRQTARARNCLVILRMKPVGESDQNRAVIASTAYQASTETVRMVTREVPMVRAFVLVALVNSRVLRIKIISAGHEQDDKDEVYHVLQTTCHHRVQGYLPLRKDIKCAFDLLMHTLETGQYTL